MTLEILSVAAAAEILGIGRQRIWRLCKQGTLDYQSIGRYKFPTRVSVEAYKISPERLLRMPHHGPTRPAFMRRSTFPKP